MSEDPGPVQIFDLVDDEQPRLVGCMGRDYDHVWIVPQSLRLDEIDPMFLLVRATLAGIKLELHGIKNIPEVYSCQAYPLRREPTPDSRRLKLGAGEMLFGICFHRPRNSGAYSAPLLHPGFKLAEIGFSILLADFDE